MKKQHLLLLLAFAFTALSCNSKYPDLDDGMYAEFVTNKGTFVAELYYKATPITVANFVSLAEGTNKKVDSSYAGKKFYDGLTFHRIIDNFMIQGGDPKGNGSGGPGYSFPDEFNDTLQHDTKGILSMANSGPNTNGSQFFITLKETPHLNGRHSIFGKIVEGQQVIDSLGKVETAAQDKPVKEVVIKKLNIIRKGKEAKDFNASKVFEEKLADIEAEKEKKQQALENEIKTLAEGYEKTDSGLRYKITETNEEGEKPNGGDQVKVHYTGMLANGEKFDSSYDRGKPLEFPVGVGKVIPGWDEGIRLLKTGEKARLIIPPYLGYGERGAGGVIPPNAILIFDVELVGIN
ncbi:peptidylprolyl isomerase [Mesonia aquimarina]|uniref:peptidylprolyl isomerase n=1 Tax=Mesonia aquimarina TaxID=1504967 RepID=UPI000EF5D0F2|nr:peptidylprolyl isomerase [Mesonia aquimarina]